ncbi:hypothetical protein VNO77_23378 [Canavalia gladiata]|uniref:Uncharacterized protein n=1 Tax=Canavalia gladiata TaxID=3824 RepID=A0AAN9QBG1_CANGL
MLGLPSYCACMPLHVPFRYMYSFHAESLQPFLGGIDHLGQTPSCQTVLILQQWICSGFYPKACQRSLCHASNRERIICRTIASNGLHYDLEIAIAYHRSPGLAKTVAFLTPSCSHGCHFGDCPLCSVPIEKECIGGPMVQRILDVGKARQCGSYACGRIFHPSFPCPSLRCGSQLLLLIVVVVLPKPSSLLPLETYSLSTLHHFQRLLILIPVRLRTNIGGISSGLDVLDIKLFPNTHEENDLPLVDPKYRSHALGLSL